MPTEQVEIEKDGLQRYFENHGYTGNAMIPLIMVKAYRKSGKWYNTKISPIEGEILDYINNSEGFIVTDLIRNNHFSVGHLSPLATGFSNLQDYYFVVEVFNVNGFMDSIITR